MNSTRPTSPKSETNRSRHPANNASRGAEDGLKLGERIAVERLSFDIDCGRFATKTIVGVPFVVEADIFSDGHAELGAIVTIKSDLRIYPDINMVEVENDRWRCSAKLDQIGAHEIWITAWRDTFATWQVETAKKAAAGLDVKLELVEGRNLVMAALQASSEISALEQLAARLREAEQETDLQFALLMTGETKELMRRVGPREGTVETRRYPLWADRSKANFSTWYELFPRSMSFSTERHGTFEDVIARLPYVRDLGFDVLYFPPIHPIGAKNRKGANNALVATPADPGSPYAIGSADGGHDAIHPELGDIRSFRKLVREAAKYDLEIALDLAIQCSPDHPWLSAHPDWFEKRPDGSIRYAENPPKKYEDIVNPGFYGSAYPGLWHELRRVVLFWVENGVRIFRVDNPHTKPLPFWEWLIAEVHRQDPGVIFLSEAFTRPKMMLRLAKLGFSQSYTYFTWRNTKAEIQEYLTELCDDGFASVFRPNFFVNTPDINPVYLQQGGRPAFQARTILAGSLSPSWGMYNGFEVCDAEGVAGKEEYLNSEKYQLRVWDFDVPANIKEDIRFINTLRKNHPALQQLSSLSFYNIWNDQILYYGKRTRDLSDFLLFAVNLDPFQAQEADFEIPLWEFGLPDDGSILGHDLVTGQDFRWSGKMQRVRLTPHERPYAVWSLLGPEPRVS